MSSLYTPLTEAKYQIKSFTITTARLNVVGHYTNYAEKDGQWYKFDDRSVTPVTPEQMKQAFKHAQSVLAEKIK